MLVAQPRPQTTRMTTHLRLETLGLPEFRRRRCFAQPLLRFFPPDELLRQPAVLLVTLFAQMGYEYVQQRNHHCLHRCPTPSALLPPGSRMLALVLDVRRQPPLAHLGIVHVSRWQNGSIHALSKPSHDHSPVSTQIHRHAPNPCQIPRARCPRRTYPTRKNLHRATAAEQAGDPSCGRTKCSEQSL